MLARWTPFQELYALQRDLIRLFDRTFGSPFAASATFVPNCEAYYKDGHFVVRAELAGVDPRTVDVAVAGHTLTIKGERKGPQVPADDRLFGEIDYGTFERAITLPQGLESDQVKARWQDGILEITIPVSQALMPRKVPVEMVRA
ncbi:MAG: Hsp20/alpha crystallin family protein [Armatimonadota bacterium]|nr:Hsp20/alpha crystallin family protein [Armatimonadota bacterium]MDR7532951.1 Hsp20/alpha crystallin family protein [Armatimonadota bacterium]MDR7537535.1 Hsp20/alpha crystallin family protein [Armatimonadota bacterium]